MGLHITEPDLNAGRHTNWAVYEYGISAKWVELLKQIAPGVTRAAVIRDPAITAGTAQFAAIQAVAPFLKVDLTPLGLRDVGEIERNIAEFARGTNGGLIGAQPTVDATSASVSIGNLHSEILVVQSAQNWHRHRATGGMGIVLVHRKGASEPLSFSNILGEFEQTVHMPFAWSTTAKTAILRPVPLPPMSLTMRKSERQCSPCL
jgi:hypothetical protein